METEYRDLRVRPVNITIRGRKITQIEYSNGTREPVSIPYTWEKIQELLNHTNYAGLTIYVSVRNRQPTLRVATSTEILSENELNLTEEQKQKLAELKTRTVQEDNQATPNQNGPYYPAPETLKKIVHLIKEKLPKTKQ